jgi:cytoskeletal protein RodZ
MAPNTRKSRRAVGETLNLPVVRQKKGIALRAIADSTKISMHFLEAIEAEQFDKLPGGVFTTSYMKQYAAAIGMDPDELLSYYRRRLALDSAEADGENTPKQTGEKKILRALTNFIF